MSIVKTNVPGLVIDTDQNLVINTDEKELQAYKAQIAQSKEINSMKSQIEALTLLVLEMRK